jgi:tripartite-type tricarboxylate transporter receptor subunit TctC
MSRLAASVSVFAAAGIAFAPWPLAAQSLPSALPSSWPSRPITMVVTFAAGGPADGTARLIANELGEKLGQRVVIENKGGAGGNIGAASVVKATPDGYTLLMVSSGPGAVNKLIYKSLPYDPLKDFAPVVLVASVPTIILVSPKLPAANLKGAVAYGKLHRRELSIGNPGYGTGGHIAAVQFAAETGLEVTHVPYRGVAPMLTDVMSGQIGLGFAGFVPQILNMKAVAVTAATRVNILPDVPTVREALGLDIVGGVWYGLLAPVGTPPAVIGRINAIVNEFFRTERGRELSHSIGMQPLGGTPEDMAALMAYDIERLGPIVRGANITMD